MAEALRGREQCSRLHHPRRRRDETRRPRQAAGRHQDAGRGFAARARPGTGARQRSAIHHVYVGNDRPLEGRDQPAFAGAWRRPLAGAELRLSARRRALHLPAAVPRQCALVLLLRGVVGRLRARGLAALFGQHASGTRSGRAGATQFNSLGAMTNILLRAPASPRDREHRVRQAMIVPLSRESYRDVSERFGVQVTSLYAMTETFAVTMFTPDDPEAKGASAGRPRGLAEMHDRQRRGRSAADRRGRRDLRAAAASPASSCPAITRCRRRRCATRRNLWLHTGDRGRLDEDGYLYFVDRKKEAIRRRGENISAYEVEMLIARHPSRAGGRGRAGGLRAQRGRGDGLRRLPRRRRGQRGRAGALCQSEHGAFHGAALRPFHRGAAQDREREDREIQAEDLGRAEPRVACGTARRSA